MSDRTTNWFRRYATRRSDEQGEPAVVLADETQPAVRPIRRCRRSRAVPHRCRRLRGCVPISGIGVATSWAVCARGHPPLLRWRIRRRVESTSADHHARLLDARANDGELDLVRYPIARRSGARPLSDLINALTSAGLVIDRVEEAGEPTPDLLAISAYRSTSPEPQPVSSRRSAVSSSAGGVTSTGTPYSSMVIVTVTGPSVLSLSCASCRTVPSASIHTSMVAI